MTLSDRFDGVRVTIRQRPTVGCDQDGECAAVRCHFCRHLHRLGRGGQDRRRRVEALEGEPQTEGQHDRPIGAILVSRYDGIPLIAYLMTAASHKARGIARGLTALALSSLHTAGEDRAHLWVTPGNEPAERIYAGFGFADASVVP